MKHSKYIELVEVVLFALHEGIWDIKYLAKSLKVSQKLIKQIIQNEYYMIGITTEFERSTQI